MKRINSKNNLTIDDPINDTSVAMLCTGSQADGNMIYAYVIMDPLKAHEYELALKKGKAVDLSTFGEIIAHGEGDTPSEEVKKEMEEKYNVNHNFEEDIRKVLGELQDEQNRLKKMGVSVTDFLEKKFKELFSTSTENS